MLELLEKEGPTLPRPYADFLTEGIHELRLKLSGDKVPESELRKSLKFKEDFLARYNEKTIKELLDEDI